jgi:hypothetical protein
VFFCIEFEYQQHFLLSLLVFAEKLILRILKNIKLRTLFKKIENKERWVTIFLGGDSWVLVCAESEYGRLFCCIMSDFPERMLFPCVSFDRKTTDYNLYYMYIDNYSKLQS